LQRLRLIAVLAVLSACAAAPSAHAAPCTAEDAPKPLAGQVALDTANSSDPAVPSFKGNKDAKDVAFVLTVSGCTLGAKHDVIVEVRGEEADAVTFSPLQRRGTSLTLDGKVDPKKFTPGEHKPRVRISSPTGQVKLQSFAMTIQRKQPFPIPLLIALAAALAGLWYAYLVAKEAAVQAYDKKQAEMADDTPADNKLRDLLLLTQTRSSKKEEPQVDKVVLGPFRLWVFVVVAAAAGAASAFAASYIKSATWDAGDIVAVATLAAAVAVAAVGGATAPLSKAVTAAEPPQDGTDNGA
jgi:hypothetical protein